MVFVYLYFVFELKRLPPHRFPDLGSRGPTAAVHDEEERLVLGALQLLLGKLLVPFEEVGGQHHIAGLSGRKKKLK